MFISHSREVSEYNFHIESFATRLSVFVTGKSRCSISTSLILKTYLYRSCVLPSNVILTRSGGISSNLAGNIHLAPAPDGRLQKVHPVAIGHLCQHVAPRIADDRSEYVEITISNRDCKFDRNHLASASALIAAAMSLLTFANARLWAAARAS